MMKVYFDYAATTPIDAEVLKAMQPYLKGEFGNPSSLHQWGQRVSLAVDGARKQVVDFLNCRQDEIIFTGSATEADNLAILGVVKVVLRGQAQKKPHIITTKIEHPAVLEAFRALEQEGVETTYLGVDRDGRVRIEDIEKAIKPNTILVSVMYVNNEIGVIQPIAEIGKIVANFRNSKSEILNSKQIQNSNVQNSKQYPVFHCDAVQAINYLDCNVNSLGVDLLTLSGHKIYGPKGVGVLFVRKGVKIEPIIYGGGQEFGMRSGTENVAGIVGIGKALTMLGNNKIKTKSIQSIAMLRDRLIRGIEKSIAGAKMNGSIGYRIPNNANISFQGVEGESILMALDQEGVAVSTGSACSSHKLEPSHTLLAIGCSAEQAHSSIRFTLGKYNTESEINYVLKVLPEIIKRLREISPLK